MNLKNQYVQKNKYTRPALKLRRVAGVVWHYTASNGASAQNIRDYFNGTCIREGRYASAQIAVDDKEAIVMVPLSEVAYHAHDQNRCYVSGLDGNANLTTVGVEMCIDKSGKLTTATFNNAVEVGAYLCKTYGLDPHKHFHRHYDITKKNCPAMWVSNPAEFTRFKNAVKAKLAGGGSIAITPAPSASNLLKLGSTGQAVKDLQTKLNKLGFNSGTVDGIFGAKTQHAVCEFQKSVGLATDGIVGVKTSSALENAMNNLNAKYPLPTGVYKLGSKGTGVKQIQTALNKAGFNCGAVDGIYGVKTQHALCEFQKSVGLVTDGIFGNKSRTALNKKVNG
jgi:N-acetylmuramoyl-L-alanine amidase